MTCFDADKLPVYRAAIAFRVLAERIATHTPRGHANLGDQLRRASHSITANIAEGAGEFAPREKARIYRIARRSAAECVGHVDTYAALGFIEAAQHSEARAQLIGIIGQLVWLVTRMERAPAVRQEAEPGGQRAEGKGQRAEANAASGEG